MVQDISLKRRLRQALISARVGDQAGLPPTTPANRETSFSGSIHSGDGLAFFGDTTEHPPLSAEAMDMEMIKTIVQQTVQAQFFNAKSVETVSAALAQSPPRSVEELSDEELLTWCPERADAYVSQQTPPVKSRFASPPQTHLFNTLTPGFLGSQRDALAQQNGPPSTRATYPFTPFSFQEPLDNIQSDTTQSPSRGAGMSPITFKGTPTPPMVTVEGKVAYNATERSTRVSTVRSKGGRTMVDLSDYKDLTKPPVSAGNGQAATLVQDEISSKPAEMEYTTMTSPTTSYANPAYSTHPEMNEMDLDIYSEYSGNVKTLVQLVNDLPEGVTKQTGAQIIRLTMEAMGISMETVLSDAQAVQSQLLDLVRTNIKKIEEYKTVIRKLESEIRFHQGKANELSEIIDLFILSNTSPNMPVMERNDSNGY